MARQPQYLAEQQRTLGRYLAALREAAGLYQSDIARAVPCHRTTVTHAEAGSQLPDSYFWETADRVTGANGALIASYDDLVRAKSKHMAEQQAKRRAKAHTTALRIHPATSTTDEATAPTGSRRMASVNHKNSMASVPGNDSDDMGQRELLRLLSVIGALIGTSESDGWIDPERPPHLSGSSIPLDTMSANEHEILNVHLWRVFVLSKFKRAVFPLVRSQLEVLTTNLGRPLGTATYQRLCTLTSELLQLAGEVHFDANKYTDAAHCYTLAAAASKEAGAFDLWACALTRHALIAVYEQHFEKAVSMLQVAELLARKGDRSLSTRYWISTVQAQTFAGLGKFADCERALDVSEQVHNLSGNVSNGGWLRFDGSRIIEERGTCYVTLRRLDLAEVALGCALRKNLPYRRRGSVLTDLAIIGAQRGDVDQLVTHADAALGIAEHTGSGFIGRKLQALRNHIVPLLGNSRVCEINERIVTLSDDFAT